MRTRVSPCRFSSRSQLLLAGLVLLVAVSAVLAAGCGSGATTTSTASASTTMSSMTTTTGATGTTVGATTTTAGGAGGAGGAKVSLANIAIDPTSVTIKVGETVSWTNNDPFAHRLVGDKGEFDSGTMAGGATFGFTFKTAGTFAYHCSIHPSMTGTVIVQ